MTGRSCVEHTCRTSPPQCGTLICAHQIPRSGTDQRRLAKISVPRAPPGFNRRQRRERSFGERKGLALDGPHVWGPLPGVWNANPRSSDSPVSEPDQRRLAKISVPGSPPGFNRRQRRERSFGERKGLALDGPHVWGPLPGVWNANPRSSDSPVSEPDQRRLAKISVPGSPPVLTEGNEGNEGLWNGKGLALDGSHGWDHFVISPHGYFKARREMSSDWGRPWVN